MALKGSVRFAVGLGLLVSGSALAQSPGTDVGADEQVRQAWVAEQTCGEIQRRGGPPCTAEHKRTMAAIGAALAASGKPVSREASYEVWYALGKHGPVAYKPVFSTTTQPTHTFAASAAPNTLPAHSQPLSEIDKQYARIEAEYQAKLEKIRQAEAEAQARSQSWERARAQQQAQNQEALAAGIGSFVAGMACLLGGACGAPVVQQPPVVVQNRPDPPAPARPPQCRLSTWQTDINGNPRIECR